MMCRMQAPTRTSPMTSSPRSRHPRTLVVAGGAVAALLLASAPASAQEAATAKATGTTTIKLSSSVKSVLKRSKVSLSGVSPARRGATAVKLPLRTATVDPTAGSGTLNHAGSLRFRRGKRSIALKTFRVAIQQTKSNVNVGVGSSRVRAFDLDTSGITIKQAKRKLTLGNLKVTLTAVGASRLNRALGVTRFKPGASFGVSSTVIDVPAGTGTGTGTGSATGALKSGTASLTLSSEAKAGLGATGASITATAPATGSGTGPYAFPITGGSLDASKGFAGSATLAGSLALTYQGQTLVLQDPIVDLAGSVVTAIVNGARVEAFSLETAGLRNVRYDGQLVLDGIVVRRAKTGPLADPNGAPSGVIGTLRLDAKTD